MSVRFDSLDPRRETRSFTFRGKLGEVVARELSEVAAALAKVAAAADAGHFAAGFVAYEAAPAFDPALTVHPPLPDLPLVWFEIYEERVEVAPPSSDPEGIGSYQLGELTGSMSAGEYESGVRAVQELIAAGDTYQVNLTLRLSGPFEGSAGALYADFVQAQRSAFCAFLPLADHTIVSASPELFFRYSGREIELRPMKGTRPRGHSSDEDDALAAELGSSPKDRAENLMIVDLLRNDLGRIAEFGSVTVPALFEVERYPTVHQLTSTVRGTMRQDVGVVEIFQALFPSGSVTGAPKVRTSEIIRELESSARGPYTGAIGFVGPGEGVFSVAIRTALVDHAARTIQIGIGSGITADSDPGAEYRESISKGQFVQHRRGEFSLIESLRLTVGGGYTFLDEHLQRLARSARYFDFAFDAEAARAALLQLPGELGAGVYKVRLLLEPSGDIAVEHQAIPPSPPEVRISISARCVDSSDPFLYHKTTRRELYQQALREAESVGDVVFLNERGEVTETTTSNIVVRIGDSLVTPPLASGLLPGVLRAHELEAGVIREQVIHREELINASEVFLLNSVRGWRKADLIG